MAVVECTMQFWSGSTYTCTHTHSFYYTQVPIQPSPQPVRWKICFYTIAGVSPFGWAYDLRILQGKKTHQQRPHDMPASVLVPLNRVTFQEDCKLFLMRGRLGFASSPQDVYTVVIYLHVQVGIQVYLRVQHSLFCIYMCILNMYMHSTCMRIRGTHSQMKLLCNTNGERTCTGASYMCDILQSQPLVSYFTHECHFKEQFENVNWGSKKKKKCKIVQCDEGGGKGIAKGNSKFKNWLSKG